MLSFFPEACEVCPRKSLKGDILMRVSKCVGCNKYPRECRTYTTPGTVDCVLCGDCIEGCRQGAVAFAARRWRDRSHQAETAAESPHAT